MSVAEATRQTWNGLHRLVETRQSARRFHRAEIGDVDPDKCFGDWLYCVGRVTNPRENDSAAKRDCRKKLAEVYESEPASAADAREPLTVTKTAMGSATGTIGGYLMPDALAYELMQTVAEEAIVRPRAIVVPMSTATLQLPIPDASTAYAAGVSPFFSGIQMKWTQDAATRAETAEMLFRQLQLEAHELTGYLLISNPMMMDAVGIDAWLRRLLAKSIGWYEDLAFIFGSGVGQPVGMASGTGIVSVNRSGGNTFVVADVGAMSIKLLPFGWSYAVWIIHPTVWGQIVVLGGATAGLWQLNQPIGEGAMTPDFIINGQGGYISEKASVLGTKGDVMLVCPNLYVIGDRLAVEVAVSSEQPTAYLNNQSAWRVVHRVDGLPMFSKTITLADGASVVSPYVVLN